MSLAFVTGANGFIGSHLVEALLDRGIRVRCLVRKKSHTKYLPKDDVELIRGDVEQEGLLREAFYGAEIVYHVAGLTAAFAAKDFLRINGDGARHVAQACAQQANPPKLVLISSIAASGPAPRGQIRVEADTPAPISEYGRSKLAGEVAAGEFAATVPLVIVRPGVVFGPRDPGLLPVFQSLKYFNLHALPGYESPALSYIYVKDLIEVILRAAERGQTVPPAGGASSVGQGVYFAVAPEYPTYADLGKLIGRLMGRPFPLVLPCLPPFPWVVAGVNEVIGRLIGKPSGVGFDKMREGLATSWACSAEKVKCDLGFAHPKSLKERLEETTAWYRAEKWL